MNIRPLAVVALLAPSPLFGQPSPRASESGPAAIVAGVAIRPEELQPALAELAGSVVLEEAVLDRLLQARLDQEKIVLAAGAREAELALLVETIADEARVTPDQAASLVADMRRARGLGPNRFDALLLRNARLRALVAGRDAVSDEDMRLAVELEYGPRYRFRIASFSSRESAANARTRILAARSADRATLLAEIAMTSSRDAAGMRGGLFPDASAADLSLPPVVRSSLPSLRPGDLSDVLASGDAYALLLLEGVTPPRPDPTPDQRAALERRVRRRLERLAMDALARELLDAARVSVMDAALRWSWEQRGR